MKRTLLDHALLGLLAQQPRSGYELRKVFQQTPLGVYSDSPGSIYPALRRLERDGLVRTQAEPAGRRTRTCRLAPAGRAALEGWLRSELTSRGLRNGEAALRLAFWSEVLGDAGLGAFLEQLAARSEAVLRGLVAVEPTLRPRLPRSARIAFELGLETTRAQLAHYRRAARASSRRRS